MDENKVAVRNSGELVPLQMTTEQLLARKKAVQDIQAKVMKENVDFGIIPGCAKPSLYKAGAETLNVTFGLRPVLTPGMDIVMRDLGKGHREYQVTVHILSAGAGEEIATGVGSCSTLETKYHYRNAERICPQCQKPAIIKGKEEYGGGWLCYKKKDGCGAKFQENDPTIIDQEVGKIEYDNPADYYNTCLKMAKKRGLVDGTINATGVSHIFTQDIEDMEKEILRDAEYRVSPSPEDNQEPAEVGQRSEKTTPEVSNLNPEDKPSTPVNSAVKGKPLAKSQGNYILKQTDGLTPDQVDGLLRDAIKREDASLDNLCLDEGYVVVTYLASHKGEIKALKGE